MTDAQKEYGSFEELTEHIVRHIFKDAKAEIKRTRNSKDGGYDIVAEFSDGKTIRKVYFECKLRSGNLNLRDIAANVIIAFNEGAVALVVFTNYNYTGQADENLRKFCRKSVLNIKIIIGEEINKLIQICRAPVSKKLAGLISFKKTKREVYDSLLQIDLSKANIHEQFLYRNFESTSDNEIFLPKSRVEKHLLALNALKQYGIIAVTGFIGIGKRLFVTSVLEELGYFSIHIDAALHETQERLLLDILLSIWGIPAKQIIEDFTSSHIDSIIKKVGGRLTDKKTAVILRRLFGDTKILGISDENYNLLICNYITELLEMHRHTIQYLFYIENLGNATSETEVLLKYFVKRLHQQKIPCVIVHDLAEYTNQRSINLFDFFCHLKRFDIIELNMFSKEEAVAYIQHCRPEISEFIAKLIVEQIGVRRRNIAYFLSYLENSGVSLLNHQQVKFETQALTPNSIPNITGKIMHSYRGGCRKLFDILFLLRGRVAESLCVRLGVELSLPDRLAEEGILEYRHGYYVCANPVVWAVLEEWGSENNPALRRLALSILQSCEQERAPMFDVKAHLLRYMGEYEQALEELKHYTRQLSDGRQFDALISSYDTAIKLSQNIQNPQVQIQYIVLQLEILDVKKELADKKASTRLNELSELLTRYKCAGIPEHYYSAYDYFNAKRDFKKGLYDIKTGSGAVTRQHFDNAISGANTDNSQDWLGKLCCQYALRIKESCGNGDALTVFNHASKALPDSFTVRREYYSHLACMMLYDAPNEAFGYYEKIISSFQSNLTLCALPFHEYIDKAMCKLLAGDALLAESLAQEAIGICEANYVLDEWGRALNIEGCALLCQNEIGKAKALFKESSEMLKNSGYKLYSWRSQLNYIQLALEDGVNKQELLDELRDAYQCFRSLFRVKINTLAQGSVAEIKKTREYHALLVFGMCIAGLNDDEVICVFNDFELDAIKEAYYNDMRDLENRAVTALSHSPYYKAGRIIMVG